MNTTTKKPTRSPLQKIATFTTWVKYYFLKPWIPNFNDNLPIMSLDTMLAIREYNEAVDRLRKALTADYEAHRALIIARKEKEKSNESKQN